MATFILIHGAYQDGWVWQPLAKNLKQAGHEVRCPPLDGCAERAHQVRSGITTETHGDEIAQLLFYEDLTDVTLVAPSNGGMVMAKAAELARDRVAKVIFVSAVALQDGERLSDVAERKNAFDTPVASGPPRSDVTGRIFKNLEEPIKSWAIERYTLHPIACLTEPVELKHFWKQQWDATVIWCKQSVNPSKEHQKRAADTLGARWFELDTGHYPMLTEPDALASLILSS